MAFAVLGGAAAIALLVAGGLLVLFVQLSWPHVEALGNPQFGINFSCSDAEYLLLEDPAAGAAGYVDRARPERPAWCASTLGDLLERTGAKQVRLSVEWSQVEPREGEYDFAVMDALVAEAASHGATVLLGVGVKAQRHPEFYVPGWVTERALLHLDEVISNDPFLHDQALAMVGAVVGHYRDAPAIDSWEADNEPYVASSRSEQWTLSRSFVAEEVAAIKANDGQGRPVVINHAQHFVFDRRWKDALADGDVLAASIYPFRNYEILGRQFVVPILEIGPLAPNYAAQARAARSEGKQFWITEMQAEPWYDGDMRLLSPANPSPNLTHENFARNVEYARRSGGARVYLWGSEWWLYEAERFGDRSWLEQGAAAIATGAPGNDAGASVEQSEKKVRSAGAQRSEPASPPGSRTTSIEPPMLNLETTRRPASRNSATGSGMSRVRQVVTWRMPRAAASVARRLSISAARGNRGRSRPRARRASATPEGSVVDSSQAAAWTAPRVSRAIATRWRARSAGTSEGAVPRGGLQM